jgi:hypothetical protein
MNYPASVRIGGVISTSDYMLVVQGNDAPELYRAA